MKTITILIAFCLQNIILAAAADLAAISAKKEFKKELLKITRKIRKNGNKCLSASMNNSCLNSIDCKKEICSDPNSACKGKVYWLVHQVRVSACGCYNGEETCVPFDIRIKPPSTINKESIHRVAKRLRKFDLKCVAFGYAVFRDERNCNSCQCRKGFLGPCNSFLTCRKNENKKYDKCFGNAIWTRGFGNECGCVDGMALCTNDNAKVIEYPPFHETYEVFNTLQRVSHELKDNGIKCIQYTKNVEFKDEYRCSPCFCTKLGSVKCSYQYRHECSFGSSDNIQIVGTKKSDRCQGEAIWFRDINDLCMCWFGQTLCMSDGIDYITAVIAKTKFENNIEKPTAIMRSQGKKCHTNSMNNTFTIMCSSCQCQDNQIKCGEPTRKKCREQRSFECSGDTLWFKDGKTACGCYESKETCIQFKPDIDSPVDITVESLQHVAKKLQINDLKCVSFSHRYNFKDENRCKKCKCHGDKYKCRGYPCKPETKAKQFDRCRGRVIWTRNNATCGCYKRYAICTSDSAAEIATLKAKREFKREVLIITRKIRKGGKLCQPSANTACELDADEQTYKVNCSLETCADPSSPCKGQVFWFRGISACGCFNGKSTCVKFKPEVAR